MSSPPDDKLPAVSTAGSPRNQLTGSHDRDPGKQTLESCDHRKKQDLIKLNGWGYRDSQFVYDPVRQVVSFTGQRYEIGNKRLPLLRDWAIKTLGVNFDKIMEPQASIPVPEATLNQPFIDSIRLTAIPHSMNDEDRIFRAHGHTMHEAFILSVGSFIRIPDIVIWPKRTDDVIEIVKLAVLHNVTIIPFGGGTSVSGGLECPAHEKRMIVSLDTTQMNRCLKLDKANLTATFEAGITGQDLEQYLAQFDLCTGHEPDSFEFSTLGGWVATRASGMKKNVYGNIEDLMIHAKMVTSLGVVERNCRVPRLSCGPDVNQMMLGSEGQLGVITEVTLKVRPLPECRKYGSIIMPNFEQGILFMREVARRQLKPASIRLVDNEQFIFGQALKPEIGSFVTGFFDYLKKFYITKLKGFNVDSMCVVTLLFEGSKKDVESLERETLKLGEDYGGLSAGEENGKRGYMLTFVIAYVRDLAMQLGVVGESFETSIPWSKCAALCNNVKARIRLEAKAHKLRKPLLISCRVTQVYDAGACVYFYFAFNYEDGFEPDSVITDPVKVYENIEAAARDEIMSLGGSLSHHHGIGKIRRRWMEEAVSPVGLGMIKSIKQYVDPLNTFANGNLFLQSKL